MIAFFNMRISLWTKSVLDSFFKNSVIACLAVVFLLNTIGVALFVFQYSNLNDASTATKLVQSSTGLLLALGLILLGAVIIVRISAESQNTTRLAVKTIVFFMGAGLFTITQLVRMASSFYMWKIADTEMSEVVLSKPTYYITGMGLEILTLVLYTLTRIDLLFASAPTLASSNTRRLTTADSFRSLADSPLHMNSVVVKGSRSMSAPTTEYSPTDASTPPLDGDNLTPSRGQGIEGGTRFGSDDLRSGMFISIQRTFSISSQVVPHSNK